MPTERIDHFARIRSEPEAVEEVPEGAPVVLPHLIEWLEAQFPVNPPSPPFNSVDSCAWALGEIATQHGEQRVIAYLKLLMRAG